MHWIVLSFKTCSHISQNHESPGEWVAVMLHSDVFALNFQGQFENPPLWSLEMQIGKDRKLVQLPSSGTLLPRVSSYY